MSRVETFEQLRPLLFSVAYRILGSVADAQDAVQESWVRFAASPVEPDSPKAYLSTVVTRLSLDQLRSVRRRREEYPGPWFPEPLLSDPYTDPERAAELADSVSMAALVLLERLTPLERAVFVLREVFGFAFDEVAAAVGRSEAACRQLAARSRRHMQEGRPRFAADRREQQELADRFFEAFAGGELSRLEALLAADVTMVGDAGGKAPQWPAGIAGARNVARVLAAMVPGFLAIGGTVERHEVNGQPGAVLRDQGGAVVNTLALEVVDGQVTAIRAVTNPDKLVHLGPVADGYAVLRATRAGRGSSRDRHRNGR